MSEAQTPSTDKPPGGELYDYRGKLLIAEPPLQVLPTLAKLLKLGPAMFLQQVHWWVHFGHAEKGIEIVEHGGRTWVRLTPEILERKFSFVDHRTLQRYVSSLRTAGVLLTENLNKIRLDPTLWYAVDYERLHQLEQGLESPPDPGDGSVVHDDDILSFASATQKKATTKRRSGNDKLSSSTYDNLSPSTYDNLSQSTKEEESREKEQQQPKLALVEAAPTVDVVVDSSAHAEGKGAAAPQEDACGVEDLVRALVGLKTGAAARVIRQAVQAHPDHAAYWLREWEGELPHLPTEKYSLASLLLARLQDVGMLSTHDLAQQSRARAKAARPTEPQQLTQAWAESERADRKRRAEAAQQEEARLDEAFAGLLESERQELDAAIASERPWLKLGSPGHTAERRVRVSQRQSAGVSRETPAQSPQAVGELLGGTLPTGAPAPARQRAPRSPAMLQAQAALEKRLQHGFDVEDLEDCRDSIGAMLDDDEWEEVVSHVRQVRAA